jgi:pyruvate formate-lyase activating enzyme-like uncharacterized protein
MDQIERDALVEANRREYGEAFEHMGWLTPEEGRRAEEARAELVRSLDGRAEWCCGSTKVDCRSLSPGCRACAEGTWSCLFVNGVCNARCYYCPSEQREAGEPVTNNIGFRRPEDYAAYLRRFGFRGSSMSGGEPLLTLDRTLRFLSATRAALGHGGHLWMYTNGILLTQERLDLLVETGLDEIRIDLTATAYDLGPVRLAASRVPVVTVEIPALPEDEDRLFGLLPDLVEAGVKFLNLHELRATPHNLTRLLQRGHRFRHGAHATVLGSELTALRVLLEALDRGIRLPVNYCSAVYKSLYQARAARARAAEAARATHETVTSAGYIRELWRLDDSGGRLAFDPGQGAAGAAAEVAVRYHSASLRSTQSYRAAFREIELDSGVSVVVEREPATETRRLSAGALAAVLALSRTEAPPAGAELPEDLLRFERLPHGLPPYF